MKHLLNALTTLLLVSVLASPIATAQSTEQDFGLATADLHTSPTIKKTVPVHKAVQSKHVTSQKVARPRPVARRTSTAKPYTVAKKSPVVAAKQSVVAKGLPIGQKSMPTQTKVSAIASKTTPVAKTAVLVPKPAAVAPAQVAVTPKPSVAPTQTMETPNPVGASAVETNKTQVLSAAPVSEVNPSKSTPVREDKVAMILREASEPKPVQASSTDWVKTGFSTLLKLAFVLALAYLTIRGLKKFQDKRETAPQRSKEMQLVDTLKLTPANTLHVVKIQGKTLLISSTASQVTLLTEMEAEPEVAPEPVVETRFAEYLEKYNGPSNSTTTAGRVAGLLRDATAHLRNRCVVSAIKVEDQDAA